MMSRFATRFSRNRRGAVALVTALSLLPLMYLVGLAIDLTFLSQNRSQTVFSSQAASVQATLVAASTYSLEVYKGTSSTTAAQIALADADIEGNYWYNAELGSLTRGSTSSSTTVATYDGLTTGQVNAAVPPNFATTVSASASYPPLFDPLFHSTASWNYAAAGSATTNFSYAQILMLLDTSNSMLIGANQSDITTMEEDSVCPLQGVLTPSSGNYLDGEVSLNSGYYQSQANDNDSIDFTQVPNYVDPNPTSPNANLNGSCAANYGLTQNVVYVSGLSGGLTGTVALAACALACHTSTNTFTDPVTHKTYPADLYGLARDEGVTLRVDTVLAATEQIIQEMEQSQEISNQLSIGVYQFNADALTIVKGSAGDFLPEATDNLAGALTAVYNVDYTKTPTELAIPALTNSSTTYSLSASPETISEGGDTNLQLAIQHLVNGTTTGTPLSAGGIGSSATVPQKFVFIVTDGMSDSNPANGGGEGGHEVYGEMTSISGEAAGTGVCSQLKNLDYTVYVLYITYYPVSIYQYYVSPAAANAATLADFPLSGSSYYTWQTLSEVPSVTTLPDRYTQSPEAQALEACASSPSDFYSATTSADITEALDKMLHSALSSTIRLTN
jgi:Flp pilus assembly protein TadG